MRLLLTSSGITNPTLADSLLRLLEKPFKTSKIVFVPTACTADAGDKTWLINDMVNLKNLGFPEFQIADISVMPKTVWMNIFRESDLLVFGGGTTLHLMRWIKKSGLAAMLPELLQTKVYMGISAGSMVAAKTLALSSQNILYYEKSGTFKSVKGLGLVDFDIRPHLNSPFFPKVRIDFLDTLSEKFPVPFYAIDDATAVCVEDSHVRVVSEGKWKLYAV